MRFFFFAEYINDQYDGIILFFIQGAVMTLKRYTENPVPVSHHVPPAPTLLILLYKLSNSICANSSLTPRLNPQTESQTKYLRTSHFRIINGQTKYLDLVMLESLTYKVNIPELAILDSLTDKLNTSELII